LVVVFDVFIGFFAMSMTVAIMMLLVGSFFRMIILFLSFFGNVTQLSLGILFHVAPCLN